VVEIDACASEQWIRHAPQFADERIEPPPRNQPTPRSLLPQPACVPHQRIELGGAADRHPFRIKDAKLCWAYSGRHWLFGHLSAGSLLLISECGLLLDQATTSLL
jgi:hypothetical protein